MVNHLDPCCCLSNNNTQVTSSVIGCCLKEQKVGHEEDPGFELEFRFLSSLADQLQLEILLRLPAKTVCRYKVVCKPWCSLISSSHFISRFINLRDQREPRDTQRAFTLVFQHSIEAPCPLRTGTGYKRLDPIEAVSNHPGLYKSYKGKSVSLNFLPTVRPENVGRDIIYPKSEPIRLRASCADLLLCSYFSDYYVVNLLTTQWIALPTRPRRSVPRFQGCFSGDKSALCCYHDQKDVNNGNGRYRFKVIFVPGISDCYSPENVQTTNIRAPPEIFSSKFMIQMYSSETRQWTEVMVDWYPLQLNTCLSYSPILAYDGMLHWLNAHSLVSLDPFSGDANLNLSNAVKLPCGFVLDCWSCFGICVGRLWIACRVFEQGSEPALHVWELEDRCSGSSWLLAHKVELHKLGPLCYNIRAIAFHPYKRDVILMNYKQNVYFFNMHTERFTLFRKVALVKGWKWGRESVVPVPPLLHQWFPTPVPSPPAVQDAF